MVSSADRSVSVIIPVFNGGEKFRRCLESLQNCSPAPLEVIVVADGESDGFWRIAEQFGCKVVVLDQSHGPAFARNRGAEIAKGEILYFVDADVTVGMDVIGVIRKVFERYPGIAAVIGSYDDDPMERNYLSQFKNLIHHYVHQQSREEASTFWGACGAVKRDAFQAVKGFDEAYRTPSIEDIDLGYRLKEKGYAIRLEKTLFVKHMKRWEVLSMLKADILYRALPWSELIIRKKRVVNDLNLTVASRVSVMLVFLMLLSLLLMVFAWQLSAIAVICSMLLIIINRDVYQFFLHKRGWVFAIKSIFWHWLYYFYSGAVFAYVFGKVKLLNPSNK